MSGELEITGGGAIAVDSEQMRAVSERMAAAAARLADAGESVRRAHQTLSATWSAETRVDRSALWAGAQALSDEADALSSDAVGTAIMADAFELADLRARQEMLAIRRPAEADRLQLRIDELVASYPDLDSMAVQLTASWERRSQEGLFRQWGDQLVAFARPMLAFGITALMRDMDRRPHAYGVLPKGTRLHGPPSPVTVTRIARSTPASTAGALSQLVKRIPKGEAQIAVEKRMHRDGSVSFVGYADGTRSLLGADDPWDMSSNWDIYMDREQGASYHAFVQALKLAGAEPGQRVDLVGYSQGGAVVSSVAMSGVFDTSTVVLVGSPVVPSLGEDQTLVRFFHTDDPVGSGLTGGGPAHATGGPDSVTVSREYAHGASPFSVVGHPFDAHLETIRMAEDSGDVRVEAVTAGLRADAADIVSVERMEFRATRP